MESAVNQVGQLAGSLLGGRAAGRRGGPPVAADAALEFTARWVAQLRRLEALVDGLGMAVALASGVYVRGDEAVAGAVARGSGPDATAGSAS